MARLSYETADSIVYDPVAAHRNATRAVLYSLGFRNIEMVSTIDDFTLAIRRNPPDLAICEAQGTDTSVCETIQSLRQGSSGHFNPFLVIIVTAWERTDTLVKRVLNSGADDLLLRPFSTALLRQRIDIHVERRKHFVITHDYVGPDRRRDPSRIPSADLFQPPNSLKMKALDGLTPSQTQMRMHKELVNAKVTLNTEKLRRDAFQICILWRLLQELDEEGQQVKLTQLRLLTQGIARRCRDTEYEAATQWCDSLMAASEGLQFGVDHNASMHLLGHAALSLNQVLHPEKSKNDHQAAIEEAVASIKARAIGRSTSDDTQVETASA